MSGVQRLLLAILCSFAFAVRGQSANTIDQPVSISFRQDSLSTAIIRLQSVINGDFAYDPQIIPHDKLVSADFVRVPLRTVLDELLSGTGLYYKISSGAIILGKKRPGLFTIDGHITDKSSGEELIGASVYLAALRIGTVSNQYGFYSLTVPEGDYELLVSSVGFLRSAEKVHLDKNVSANFTLSGKNYDLNEISLRSSVADQAFTSPGIRNLPVDRLKNLPFYAGESDVIKAIQMQNGTKAMTEGSAGLFVRGGNIDQNLITLDEAMIYNPSHLFGLVSVFNSDAIKNITIYNDYQPANFGGRLSSVIDVRMADGNNKEFHLKGGVNLLSVHLAAEGPIKKEKGSYIVTVRRSLIDLLNHNFKIVNPNSSYYDLNAKANYQLSPNNRLLYSVYLGDDRLYAKNSYSNNWGNVTSTLRWNHEFNSKLFFNLSAIYSNYRNLLDVNADTISEKYQWKTGIRDYSLKGDFAFYLRPGNQLKFGAATTLHRFLPGEATNGFASFFNIPRDRSWETAAYFSHEFSITKQMRLSYGLRGSSFNTAENQIDQFDASGNLLKAKEYSAYLTLEPRASVSYQPDSVQLLRFTYNHNYQFLQLIQNNELTYSSLETWMPASRKTKPQRSDYFSAGYEYSPGRIRSGVTFYYKRSANQIELLNHTQVIKNPAIRDKFRSGVANAYGAELNLTGSTDKLNLEFSYSYSRVFRKIRDINDGNYFRANYDVPHEFKTTQNYQLSKRASFNSFFTLASGRVATLPVGYFVQDGIRVPIFEGRNRSRFPLFHRWDASAKLELGKTGAGSPGHTLSAGLYNVYNKKNLVYYRIKQATDQDLNLFESTTGIIPWLSYSFRF